MINIILHFYDSTVFYVFFQLERSNFFLVNMIKCAHEPVDSRTVAMLLSVSTFHHKYFPCIMGWDGENNKFLSTGSHT